VKRQLEDGWRVQRPVAQASAEVFPDNALLPEPDHLPKLSVSSPDSEDVRNSGTPNVLRGLDLSQRPLGVGIRVEELDDN
jgi:hypothetical protein